MKTCCKDCKERYVGCHSDCEVYKKMKEKQAEINKRRKQENYYGESGWNFSRSRKHG